MKPSAGFGNGRSVSREHFVEEGFFQHGQLIVLTLMKGDEVVEGGKEATDRILLAAIGQHQFHLGKLFSGNLKER